MMAPVGILEPRVEAVPLLLIGALQPPPTDALEVPLEADARGHRGQPVQARRRRD